MRKKLLIGLAAVMVFHVVGSIFVIRGLNVILSHQSLWEHQEELIDRYEELEVGIRDTIIALYRYRSGEIQDLKHAVLDIRTLEGELEEAHRASETMEGKLCGECHAQRPTNVGEIRATLADLRGRLGEYHDRFAGKADPEIVKGQVPTDDEIIGQGKAIAERISETLRSYRHMRNEVGERTGELVDRSKLTVYLVLSLSIALVLLSFVVMIQAVTRPVDAFVQGIRSVKEGDLRRKLEIRSKDEIGYLAGEFNSMIDRLNEMHVEKDRNLADLADFNARLEEKVKEATVDLARANQELKNAQEQMVRAETMAAIGTLSSGISHELSTPLSVVLNMAQLVKQDVRDDPALLKDIEVIEYEANQAIKITRSLLGFARSTQSRKEITHVNDVLEDLFKILEFQPKAKSIRLVKRLAPGLSPIRAGSGQLRQVFLNVILNAVQAMPGGGELRVVTSNRSEPLSEGVEIEITDTGVGIPREQIKQIFQPFFTTKEQGTGFGLAITYGIIREHNGRIDVESVEGQGTTFRIFLPKGTETAAP